LDFAFRGYPPVDCLCTTATLNKPVRRLSVGVGRQAWLPLFAVGFLFVGLFLLSRSVPEEELRALIERAGPWGPVLLMALLLVTYIIVPLSSSPLVFAGFYAFGTQIVFYTAVASWVSSVTNFWLARVLGRSAAARLIGADRMVQVDGITRRYGLPTLLFLRVFETELHKLISYAFGLTSIEFWPYLIVSTLGMLPGIVIWSWLASHVDNPLLFTVLTQVWGVALSGLVILGAALVRSMRPNDVR
jgi:uncharacterized membrane protein YdjX (TVP38/TMEM64 family)